MRLVLAGTPEVALPSFDLLADSAHEVVAVVTRPDAPRGRSGRPVPSPVGAWAAARGFEVLKPATPRDKDFQDRLRTLAPDACPIVAYGGLLPQEVLDIPRLGWVNLHFSLLPRWRGAAPAQRSIIAGDEFAGASTFRVVKPLDAGPVFGTVAHRLTGRETAGELLATLAHKGAPLLLQAIDDLETVEPTPQPAEGVTVAPKLTVEEARLDWTRPAVELDRLIRGCSPEPMAWTMLAGERIKIALAIPLDTGELAPGEGRAEKRRMVVGTGQGDLELVRVQPPGKKEMAAADWGRGLHVDLLTFDHA